MHVVIQFPLYENIKQRFAEAHGDRSDTLNLCAGAGGLGGCL